MQLLDAAVEIVDCHGCKARDRGPGASLRLWNAVDCRPEAEMEGVRDDPGQG